jgi:hypothetical protein
MHTLEYLLSVLSRRISRNRKQGVGDAALSLASASHAYVPEGEETGLESMHADWHRRYDKLMHGGHPDQPSLIGGMGILVLGYNRPYHLQAVLESLRIQGKAGSVHAWIDGTQGRAST